MNLGQVFHSLVTGVGCNGLRKLSGFIGREPMSAGSYSRHCKFLYSEMNEHYAELQKQAHKTVSDYYINNGDLATVREVALLIPSGMFD